jgi:D-alanyl-D-alanine carboxypeptidase
MIVTSAIAGTTGVADAAVGPDPVLRQDVAATVAAGAAGVLLRTTRNGVLTQYQGGTAVLGTDRPVPLDSRFRVGSVTKMFLSTVLLQLVAADRVDLDAPVARYLPGLLPDGDAITVRMIMQHTSGVYDYTDDLPATRRSWPPGSRTTTRGNRSSRRRPSRCCSHRVPSGATRTPTISSAGC